MALEKFCGFEYSKNKYLLENLFVLNEEKCMAKFSLNEFKNFFKSALLLESVSYDDNLMLEKAHAYYEISMLSESRKEWFQNTSPVYLDAEDHVILINNSEAFIVSKYTYRAINEWWTWEDVKGAWNTFSDKVVQVAKDTGNDVAKIYDEVSDGAKKAWEWVKAAASAAYKFMKDMSWIDWATLGLGVLSACVGIIGTGIPGATIIAGVLLAITGGLHIYEGYHKYHEAIDKLKTVQGGQITKSVAAINQSLPDIAMGSIFTILGIHDISKGITQALTDPTAGAQSLAVKGSAIAGGKKAIQSMGHTLEKTIGGGWAGKAMESLGKNKAMQELAEKAAGYTGLQLAGILGHGILVTCLGRMYKECLKMGSLFMKGISWILDLPQKISNGIDTLRKNATGVIGNIIAKGLSSLVQPMAKSAAKAINKYVRPAVNSAKAWFDRQVITYDVCSKAIKEEKAGAHESLIVEEEDSIPGIDPIELPQEEVKMLGDSTPVKATEKDEKLLNKIPDEKVENKIKDETGPGYDYKALAKEKTTSESKSISMKHIKLFENFK